jgi:Tol biopolymer transport system component
VTNRNGPGKTRAIRVAALLAAVALVAACAAGPAAPIDQSTAVPSSAALPSSGSYVSGRPASSSAASAVCFDRRPSWVEQATKTQDGIPDPTGRIVFGQELRQDEILGQVVGPLFAIDPDGSDFVQILGCEVERPRLSPDGRRLAFSIALDNRTWQVATSAVDGSDLQILTRTPGFAEMPDWGPDGSWLIYALSDDPCVTCPNFHETLWRMKSDGSDQRQVGDPKAFDGEPRLSPDGREVVVMRVDPSKPAPDGGPSAIIATYDLETGVARQVTADDQVPEHPDWSRDGRSIVYNTYWEAGGLEQVKRVPANDPTAAPVVLYGDHGHDGFKPAYSPDGSRIVFGCGAAMCLMNADGSHVDKLLVAPGVQLNHFTWGVSEPAG